MLEFKRAERYVSLNKSIDNSGIFEGYASIYDEVDQQNDRVVRGAFAQTIASWKLCQQMPKMLWQHNPEHIIGTWLSIEEDHKGLKVKGRLLLDLLKAQEAYTLVKSKAIDGLSIGYK